jgi:hypothetical protein
MSNPSFRNPRDEWQDEDDLSAAISPEDLQVFIRCRTCGLCNRFEEIPARRVDLALFRGSEDPVVKCKGCQADMNTTTAFCGEQVGSEVLRRMDPK